MDTKFFDLQRFAIYGTEGNDNLVNNADYRLIHGYGGNDTIDSTSFYAPTLYGDAGNDRVYDYSGDYAKLFGNTGNDSLYVGNSRYVTVDGGDGSDSIRTWYARNASLDGGNGNDIFELNGVDKMTVTGGKGDDTIFGDTLIGSTYGNGVLFKYAAGDGLDVIQSFKSTDTLSLTGVDRYELLRVGNDVIINILDGGELTLGGAGRYSNLNISGGKATVIPKRGSNTQSGVSVIGSEGNDRLSNYGNRVTLYALGDDDTKSPLTLASGIEFVNAGKRTTPIQITGNASDNSIRSGKASDKISGMNGNDTIRGNSGDDSILGGDGSDVLFGDDGNDSLTGGYGNDSLNGGVGSDYLSGGKGDDLLNGDFGDDILYGDAGNDSLTGGYGNDFLTGGSGDDTLTGGRGNDSLWGDAGADTFIYEFGDGRDTINAFADDDMLEIVGAFTASVRGNDIFFRVGSTDKALTLHNFTASTFNINGNEYRINRRGLVRK